jgi:glycosyltransferase involved in cell wall biosynthesis
MNKKKYLVITEVFYPESFLVNDLCFALKDKGHDIEVLTRTPSYPLGVTMPGFKNRFYQKNFHNGVATHRIPIVPGYAKYLPLKILNYLCFVICATMAVLFIGKKYEKVFVYQTGPLTVAIPGVIWKKIFGRELIIYTQDVWPDTVFAYGFKKRKLLISLLTRFTSWIYRNADTILVSCKGFTSKVVNYSGASKTIKYIPNWSLVNNHDELLPAVDCKLSHKMNFTFAGNIGKVQNLENVIKGFHAFNSGHQGATLNIIGDGSHLQEIKELVENEQIGDVVFWGRKPLEEMPAYLGASNVLVISLIDKPIFELTVPSKFQAYISMRKPLLGVIKGETAHLINENSIGICADPESIENIANAFNSFYTLDKADMARLEMNAGELNRSEFDRSKLIDQIAWILLSTGESVVS